MSGGDYEAAGRRGCATETGTGSVGGIDRDLVPFATFLTFVQRIRQDRNFAAQSPFLCLTSEKSSLECEEI